MALADRRKLAEKKSKFDQWLDGLSATNYEVVTSWLDDPTISNAQIAAWVREDDEEDDFTGYPAGKDTISIARRNRGTR